jgi:hypothetical protein
LIHPLLLQLPSCIRVDFEQLETWIFGLLWESVISLVDGVRLQGRIFRVKGHTFDGRVHRYFQAVEQVYDAETLPLGDLPENTFLLIIGALSPQDTQAIKDSFYGTFAASSR